MPSWFTHRHGEVRRPGFSEGDWEVLCGALRPYLGMGFLGSEAPNRQIPICCSPHPPPPYLDAEPVVCATLADGRQAMAMPSAREPDADAKTAILPLRVPSRLRTT